MNTYNTRIIFSNRKTLSIQLQKDLSILVRAPQNIKQSDIDDFLKQKAEWIHKHMKRLEQANLNAPKLLSEDEKTLLLLSAKQNFAPRVVSYALKLGVKYNKITFRCQRTRWGSCSSKGNLNFNYLLMLCPKEVQDYVIVHELCHLVHLNHSKSFWQTVQHALPTYKAHQAWLKENGNNIMRRI